MNVTLHESWKEILKDEFNQPYFVQLATKLGKLYRDKKGFIFPKETQIFRAFDLCPFDEVKVVILGQDPYPTRSTAWKSSFRSRPTPKRLRK